MRSSFRVYFDLGKLVTTSLWSGPTGTFVVETLFLKGFSADRFKSKDIFRLFSNLETH